MDLLLSPAQSLVRFREFPPEYLSPPDIKLHYEILFSWQSRTSLVQRLPLYPIPIPPDLPGQRDLSPLPAQSPVRFREFPSGQPSPPDIKPHYEIPFSWTDRFSPVQRLPLYLIPFRWDLPGQWGLLDRWDPSALLLLWLPQGRSDPSPLPLPQGPGGRLVLSLPLLPPDLLDPGDLLPLSLLPGPGNPLSLPLPQGPGDLSDLSDPGDLLPLSLLPGPGDLSGLLGPGDPLLLSLPLIPGDPLPLSLLPGPGDLSGLLGPGDPLLLSLPLIPGDPLPPLLPLGPGDLPDLSDPGDPLLLSLPSLPPDPLLLSPPLLPLGPGDLSDLLRLLEESPVTFPESPPDYSLQPDTSPHYRTQWFRFCKGFPPQMEARSQVRLPPAPESLWVPGGPWDLRSNPHSTGFRSTAKTSAVGIAA